MSLPIFLALLLMIGHTNNSFADGPEAEVTLKIGEARENLVNIGAWNGSKGESFETVEKEETEHYNFVALPYIDTQPKDAYVWSTILIEGAIGFTVIEVRRYRRV